MERVRMDFNEIKGIIVCVYMFKKIAKYVWLFVINIETVFSLKALH